MVQGPGLKIYDYPFCWGDSKKLQSQTSPQLLMAENILSVKV